MRKVATALIIASLLAGCGVRGALERPAPMFGKARADYLAQQERQKAEEAAKLAAGDVPAPPAPDQPIKNAPIQAGAAPPVATTPAR